MLPPLRNRRFQRVLVSRTPIALTFTDGATIYALTFTDGATEIALTI